MCLVPSCSFWCSGFCNCYPGDASGFCNCYPGDCLSLVARRVCVLGSHQSITIGEIVLGRLPTLRHFTDSRQKYIFSLCIREANLLVLELQPQGQASIVAHIQRLQKCCQGTQARECQLCVFFLLYYSSLVSLRKELVYSSGAPFFLPLLPREHLQTVWLWGPAGLHLQSHRYFKGCCLRVWL